MTNLRFIERDGEKILQVESNTWGEPRWVDVPTHGIKHAEGVEIPNGEPDAEFQASLAEPTLVRISMIDLDELEQLAKSTMSSNIVHICAGELLDLIAIARAARIFKRHTSTSNHIALVEALKAIKSEGKE